MEAALITSPWVRAACITTGAVAILEMVKIYVLVDVLTAAFALNAEQTALLLAIYPLCFGLIIIPAGLVGDRGRRKGALVLGLLGFSAACAWASLAGSSVELLVARGAQGAFVGIAVPQALAMLQSGTEVRERSRSLAWYGTAGSVSLAIGPVLGGAFAASGADGWRYSFLAMLPIATAAAIVVAVKGANAPAPVRRPSADGVGLTLLLASVLAVYSPILLPASTIPRGLYALAALAPMAAFVLWEFRRRARGRDALFSASLVRAPAFLSGLGIAFAIFAAVPALTYLATWFVQSLHGMGPTLAGSLSIPFALASVLASLLAARTLRKTDGRRLLAVGLATLLCAACGAAGAMVSFETDVAVVALFVALAAAGFGSGLVVVLNQTLTLRSVPRAEVGIASAMSQLAQRLGTSAGLGIVASIVWSLTASASSAMVLASCYLIGVLLVAAMLAAVGSR